MKTNIQKIKEEILAEKGSWRYKHFKKTELNYDNALKLAKLICWDHALNELRYYYDYDNTINQEGVLNWRPFLDYVRKLDSSKAQANMLFKRGFKVDNFNSLNEEYLKGYVENLFSKFYNYEVHTEKQKETLRERASNLIKEDSQKENFPCLIAHIGCFEGFILDDFRGTKPTLDMEISEEEQSVSYPTIINMPSKNHFIEYWTHPKQQNSFVKFNMGTRGYNETWRLEDIKVIEGYGSLVKQMSKDLSENVFRRFSIERQIDHACYEYFKK